MRHPNNGATIRPAERDRGCIFKDDFRSQANMEASGWTLFGTPTFDARGMVLNGTTQYATIPLQRETYSPSQTFHLEFYPAFEADDGIVHRLISSPAGSAGRIILYKSDTPGTITITIGGTIVVTSLLAAYEAYWITNGRNVLSVSATSGANTAWLNGVQIGTTATAWTGGACATLAIGSTEVGSNFTPATYSRLYIGHHTSDLAEHTAVYNNTMWSWQNRAVVDLQFRTADYDIGNVRTLDSSGNGNHATLGDGSTPTTYMTQGGGRMIADGGDYLEIPAVPQQAGAFTVALAGINRCAIGDTCYWGAHAGLNNWAIFRLNPGQYRFYVGGTLSSSTANHFDQLPHTIIGVYNGSTAQIFIDGVAGSVSAATAPSGGTASIFLGSNSTPGLYTTGDLFDYKYADGEAWNQTQILDYHSNVMRRMGAEV